MLRFVRWGGLGRWTDVGLLVMRVGVGLMMTTHGYPKIAGGPALWAKLGHATEALGLSFAPTFWGAAAAFSELGGGLLLALGLGTRPAALLLAITMVVASSNHLARGEGLGTASHAIELGFVFVGLIFVGPGRYSVDQALEGRAGVKRA